MKDGGSASGTGRGPKGSSSSKELSLSGRGMDEVIVSSFGQPSESGLIF